MTPAALMPQRRPRLARRSRCMDYIMPASICAGSSDPPRPGALLPGGMSDQEVPGLLLESAQIVAAHVQCVSLGASHRGCLIHLGPGASSPESHQLGRYANDHHPINGCRRLRP